MLISYGRNSRPKKATNKYLKVKSLFKISVGKYEPLEIL